MTPLLPSQQSIEPGQVWLCLEHLETGEDCTCGLVPYVPRSEVERLRDIIGTLYMARGADAGALRAGIRAAFGQARPKTGEQR